MPAELAEEADRVSDPEDIEAEAGGELSHRRRAGIGIQAGAEGLDHVLAAVSGEARRQPAATYVKVGSARKPFVPRPWPERQVEVVKVVIERVIAVEVVAQELVNGIWKREIRGRVPVVQSEPDILTEVIRCPGTHRPRVADSGASFLSLDEEELVFDVVVFNNLIDEYLTRIIPISKIRTTSIETQFEVPYWALCFRKLPRSSDREDSKHRHPDSVSTHFLISFLGTMAREVAIHVSFQHRSYPIPGPCSWRKLTHAFPVARRYG
ncbi:MAG: hypothetical protein GEU90_11080 [Gemmatimonas sp.]|nr:hypothetical protein [Gemmatimonas sp.]